MERGTLVPPDQLQHSVDHRVILHGVSWDGFEQVLAVRGWLWRGGRLEAWPLRRGRYVSIGKSEILPAIDFALLLRHLDEPSQLTAIRRLQRDLRKRA